MSNFHAHETEAPNAANGMVSNHKKNVVITTFVDVFTVLIQAHSDMRPLLR